MCMVYLLSIRIWNDALKSKQNYTIFIHERNFNSVQT